MTYKIYAEVLKYGLEEEMESVAPGESGRIQKRKGHN